MVNSNTLLLNSMNTSQLKGGVTGSDIAPTPHSHHRSPHQLLAMTASFEHNPHMNRISPRWISHNIDPILHHCQVDTDHHGVLNRYLSPQTIHRDHDARTNLALGGSPGGGQTKIRHFLHVRGSANLAPHHKKEISRQANSKEEFTNNNSRTNMASTMTARPLPMEYFPSRRMNIPNISRGQSRSSRIRSRSIAIKRPTNEEQMEEIRLNSLAAEYDWATWRMYNRIIEHRQKHPLPYVGNEETTASKLETATATTEEGSIALVSDDDENLQEENLLQQHYPEYGEVFDLDL